MSNVEHDLPNDRPVLLLDFDGVINVFQKSDLPEVRLDPHLPPIRIPEGARDWLLALDSAFSLVWCSHWGRLLNRHVVDKLGIGKRPYLEELPEDSRFDNWKERAARRLLNNRSQDVVWIADGFSRDAISWANSRERQGARTWLFDVTQTGLTREITEELISWAEGHTRPRPYLRMAVGA